jgi:hypothetical protein
MRQSLSVMIPRQNGKSYRQPVMISYGKSTSVVKEMIDVLGFRDNAKETPSTEDTYRQHLAVTQYDRACCKQAFRISARNIGRSVFTGRRLPRAPVPAESAAVV